MEKKKEQKKNKILIVSLALVSILAIGLLVYASITLNTKHEEEDKHLIELSFKELNTKLEKKESFILVLTRTDCSHCATYKPVLKEVLTNYKITAYEVALDKLSDEEKTKFNDIANVTGTPTTIFIENGTEKTTSNRLYGSVSSNKIISRLKSLGYIKE